MLSEREAHNRDQSAITKDIEKLVREKEPEGLLGNLYHVLEHSNRGTLPSLFKKFVAAFAAVSKNPIVAPSVWETVHILFTVCVIGHTPEKSFSLQRWLDPNGFREDSPKDGCSAFFAIDGLDLENTGSEYKGWAIQRRTVTE